MDSARYVIKRILNPHLLSQMASYDMASTIHQSLGGGGGCDAAAQSETSLAAFKQAYPLLAAVEEACNEIAAFRAIEGSARPLPPSP